MWSALFRKGKVTTLSGLIKNEESAIVGRVGVFKATLATEGTIQSRVLVLNKNAKGSHSVQVEGKISHLLHLERRESA